ncbi:ADP,ATP carrier protein 3 [Labeo rohita]|uniref:ADP,ATP carrier protein 3 n=1 Tax=Labeo rohita TaxID=84645 RepID=A0ABQ8MQ83_LABRO|nr:ADP,ATP carrier protein 3 [Labeo rohita]
MWSVGLMDALRSTEFTTHFTIMSNGGILCILSSHKSRSSGSQNADKAKGNNSHASTSADTGIKAQEEGDANDESEVKRKQAAAFVLTSREKHCLSQRHHFWDAAVSGLTDALPRSQITDAIQRKSRDLEQLLSHPVVLSMFDSGPRQSKDGFFYDIIDGDIYKSHPLFSVKPNALQLILFTDEIELCNPLVSCASKNKLLMEYYTLGNINPKQRSKLAAIHLLAIAKSAVWHRTAKGERTVYGAVVSLCGDTLAQHELTGFKEGVGFAFSKCRHCECNFEDMQVYFDSDNFVKRSLDRHVRQCNEIERAATDFLRNSLKCTYGINRKSKLIEFPAFDLIRQTPQDIMHVILEGVAPLIVKTVLKHLVLSGQLDLDTLNSVILGYAYSTDVRVKPYPITVTTLSSNDNKLKQSSGQMLVLLKILSFILDSCERDEYCQVIIVLIEIVQIFLHQLFL